MSTPKNAVTAVLRGYAQKLASGGSPDRLNVADGQGGITTSKGTIPTDPGEAELKADMPADSTARSSETPNSNPDRLNVADGQGGITASKGTIPKDPGLADLKADIPADGAVRKSARVDNIRKSIVAANPALAPKVTPVASQQKSAAPAKAEPAPLDLSQDTLAKIASSVLSTEEGISFVHDLFEKQAGEAAARDMIREAVEAANAFDQTEQVKSAAYNDVFTKAASIHDNLVAQGITEADADLILKQASYHQAELLKLDHPLLKRAYAEGMDDAALMAAADEAGGAPAEGGAPMEGAPPMDEAIPMGGEQLSEEEIMALLEEMIASGEITEEEVLAAVQATEGGGEGAPAEEIPAEAPPEGAEAAMA